MEWSWQEGNAPLDPGTAWDEFVGKAEVAWCRVLGNEEADQVRHSGRRNAIVLRWCRPKPSYGLICLRRTLGELCCCGA